MARPRLVVVGRAIVWSVDGDAVGVRSFGDGLVEGRAAGPAVSAAAGGDAEGLGAVVERPTGVAWFSADVGLDHSADGATTGVADGDVECRDGATVGAGGRAGALDGLPDVGIGGGEAARVAEGGVVVAHEGVVITWEAGADRGTDQSGVAGVGVPGVGHLSAVPGREEVVGAARDDVEAEGTAVLSAVDGVTSRQQGVEDTRAAPDLDRAGVGARASLDRGDLRGGDSAVGGDDDTAGCRVHVPGDALRA